MSTDILDREEPLSPPLDPGLRRRAVRFLIYCVGIMGVIWYRTYALVEAAHASGDLDSGEMESLYRRVIPIGMAAIWLFSGLGLLTVGKVLPKQRLDFWWILLGLAHGLFFLSYSYKLVVYFFVWQQFPGLG